MINVNDFKNGVTILLDGNIYQVLEFLHVKPGKGGAFVRSKLKNLRTGAIIDYTFNAGIKVERAHIEKKQVQYLYSMNQQYYFMNMSNYEQIEVSLEKIKTEAKFLKEGLQVELLLYQGEILALMLPDKITIKVLRTEPGVRGNTSTTAMKDAYLENEMTIKVPLFIAEGEEIILSTRDGKYISRS